MRWYSVVHVSKTTNPLKSPEIVNDMAAVSWDMASDQPLRLRPLADRLTVFRLSRPDHHLWSY